jgi:hypothetical protein
MSYDLEVRTSQCGTRTSVVRADIHVARILIHLQLIQQNVILTFRREYLWSGLEPRITGNYRVDSKIKVIQVFNNNRKGSRLKYDQTKDGWSVQKQILINVELKIAERKGQETESTGRNSLRRRKSVLDWGDI